MLHQVARGPSAKCPFRIVYYHSFTAVRRHSRLDQSWLHVSTRATQSPYSATVIFVSEDVGLTPSFSLFSGQCKRQRTR